jgi:hypothetical protein
MNDYGNMVRQLMMVAQPVADKTNPLKDKLGGIPGTEGARGYSGSGKYGPYGPPKGQETYNDQFRVFTKESPWESPPKVSGPVFKPGELESIKRNAARTEAGAAERGAKFDRRVETLEVGDGIFVHLKPGYTLPSGDTAFGADSLSEARRMMKDVIKK